MAITKLLHIKGTGGSSGKHLKNAISYILNEEKTKNGLLVGGNAGVTTEEIYQTFLDTKEFYGKQGGRQGYHFVLSWKPGTVTEDQVYDMMEAFCQEYLKDEYDYVFSVHNDQEHLHGHIIFNSVSRSTGYKYHYTNGDWETKIQPVTDQICRQFGLAPLVYEEARKVGVSYGEYTARKNGRPTDSDILRTDLDWAMEKAMDYYSFLALLKSRGYQIRQGTSEKYGEYLSLRLPGMKRARRNYRRGEKYTVPAIRKSLSHPVKIRGEIPREPWIKREPIPAFRPIKSFPAFYVTGYQMNAVRKMYRARRIRSPYAERSAKAQKEIRQIRKLSEECSYLIAEHITGPEELLDRKEELRRCLRNEEALPEIRKKVIRRQLRIIGRIEKRLWEDNGERSREAGRRPKTEVQKNFLQGV